MPQILLCIISSAIHWIGQNMLNLLVSIGTLLTAFFAYRSAKMSEQSNRANFSPLIIPRSAFFQGRDSEEFILHFENISTYHNAYAKKIEVFLEGVSIDKVDSISPEANHTIYNKPVKKENIVFKKISIIYFDIMNNKFETTCTIKEKGDVKNLYIDLSDWKYIQY